MILALAITTTIALSALLLSFLAVFQVRILLKASQDRSTNTQAQQDERFDAVKTSLDSLAAEVHDLQTQPATRSSFKPGLNLSKRSQALRMHRRGEPNDQIATVLDIPPQEVELLIKVHRIVMSNL